MKTVASMLWKMMLAKEVFGPNSGCYTIKVGKAPTKARCLKHSIVVSNVEKAEGMMCTIFKARLHHDISCPCGYAGKRWNYAHHCQTKRHKSWASSMPESLHGHSWRSKTVEELDWLQTNSN
ncbi:hypothetical protein JG687_00011349 [Phytophthora cactorum]|uniref:Uncharacterized protein n=1 Tax=Phytophthora cactorum TaxID=29920 RepID=A0A8T1U771_9STRA|nr:hypothetical protein JG687_00011349 [Phytophthora cactorum]